MRGKSIRNVFGFIGFILDAWDSKDFLGTWLFLKYYVMYFDFTRFTAPAVKCTLEQQ